MKAVSVTVTVFVEDDVPPNYVLVVLRDNARYVVDHLPEWLYGNTTFGTHAPYAENARFNVEAK